ncbi:MAG TPA: carbohydrate kinase [Deinococcales bacterium]|nr:carbohydrate kinase [Deinococcales bacterium]
MGVGTRLVVFGEALIDFKGAGGLAFQGYVGGSPLNVAVAAARLGLPSALATRLSTDLFGESIAAHLAGNGVSGEYLQRGPEPSTLAFVQLRDGSATYAFRNDGAADTRYDPGDLALPATLGAVHFGSVSLLHDPGASAILRAVRAARDRALVHLDPNVRPTLVRDRAAYQARLDAAVSLAHWVKLSRDDLDWMAPGRDEAAVAGAWLARGPAVVVVTDGAGGARLYRRDEDPMHVAAPPVEVADTVGAGDTFSGATIAALLERGVAAGDLARLPRGVLAQVLAFAARAAAINCTRPGCDPPTRTEVEAS